MGLHCLSLSSAFKARRLDEWLIDYAEQLDDEAAAERIDFVFTDGDQGCMSRAEMLMHLVTHSLCHISVTGDMFSREGLPISPVLLTTQIGEMQTPA